jgi:DNA-binding LytR/AlgR family response regulator
MRTSAVLIVEDELIIAENIRSILNQGGYDNVLIAEDVDTALTALDLSDITLVVTDIAMGEGRNGIQLGEIIQAKYRIPFIYITSHASADIVGKAKHTRPSAYIIKPFKKEDVLVAVELALFEAETTAKEAGKLIVKEGRSTIRILHSEIKWMEADGNYVTIYLAADKRTVIRQSLGSLQEELPETEFIRVHKSYLVNRKFIQQVRTGVVVVDQQELPVGRSYQHLVASLFR